VECKSFQSINLAATEGFDRSPGTKSLTRFYSFEVLCISGADAPDFSGGAPIGPKSGHLEDDTGA
jgi:hypothetical protein